MRRLVVIGAVIAAALVAAADGFALVTPPPYRNDVARYLTRPLTTQQQLDYYLAHGTTGLSSAEAAQVQASLDAEVMLNSNTSTVAAAVRQGVWRSRIAAGVFPALETVGVIAGGFALGWEIGSQTNKWFLHIHTDAGTPVAAQVIETRWRWVVNFNGLGNRWVMEYRPSGAGAGVFTYDTAPDCGAQPGSQWCTAGGWGLSRWQAASVDNIGAVVAVPAYHEYDPTPAVARVATAKQMELATQVDKSKPYVAGDVVDLNTDMVPSTAPLTSTQREGARTVLDETSAADSRNWINFQLYPDPDYLDPTVATLTLPALDALTTYDDYLAQLQALGYVGTATKVQLTDATLDPDVGPNAISQPMKQTSSGAELMPGQRVPVDWPITFRVNPASAPVPSTGPGSCSCPPVDLGPLQIDFGSKFPFGVFGMLVDVVGLFNVAPVTPGFDINDHAGGTSAHPIVAPGHFAGTLSAFDSYMAIVRTLLSWVLWIGAVWFVGTRLLGFKAGGDLTEAADDGSVI